MSSDSEVESKETTLSQMGFVLLLKDEKILLNKSQVPTVKTAKNGAMVRFIKAFQTNFGKTISPEQVKKKINNMKMELKKKIDLKATGNKKIVLKQWEEKLLKLLETDGANPVLQKIPGSQTTLNKKMAHADHKTEEAVLQEDDKCSSSSRASSRLYKRNQSPLEAFETDETKKLSTPELQRLVLLEQLMYLREKRQKLKADSQHDTQMTTSTENENPYYLNL